jgi:hypothetical protein
MKDDATTGGVCSETGADRGEADLRGRKTARDALDGLRNTQERADFDSNAAVVCRATCQDERST